MLKSFVNYSRHAEKVSPRCFLSSKEYVSFLTKTRKFSFNPILHQKNSKRHLSSSSDEKNSYDIGNRRKINVLIYEGEIRIDVRQFYLYESGEEKPGKKGISLKTEEWNKLKSLIEEVDEAVTNLEEVLTNLED